MKDENSSAEEGGGVSKIAAGNAIRRSAVVLLVSHFEGFLKQLCEEMNDLFASGERRSSEIPVRLRELHTLPRLHAIATSGDSRQQHALLAKLNEIMCLWNPASSPPAGLLRSTIAVKEVTSARADVIDNLFSLFGQNHVCDGDLEVSIGGDEPMPDNIRGRLHDIVECRNDIAHGNIDRRPTDADVQRYVSFLAAFAKRLNSRVALLNASLTV